MKVTIYIKKMENPSTPNHAWLVEAPQLLAGSFGATKEEAQQKMMETALAQFAIYYKQGRFTEKDVRSLHFVEVETQMTPKELANLQPDWWKDACRTNAKEAAE